MYAKDVISQTSHFSAFKDFYLFESSNALMLVDINSICNSTFCYISLDLKATLLIITVLPTQTTKNIYTALYQQSNVKLGS